MGKIGGREKEIERKVNGEENSGKRKKQELTSFTDLYWILLLFIDYYIPSSEW